MINKLDRKKILFVVRGMMRAMVRSTDHVLAVVYDKPCPTHGVYTVCAGPPLGYALTLNIGRLFQQMVAWTSKYEEREDTYIFQVRSQSSGVSVKFSFMDVRCQIHVAHSADAMTLFEDNSRYSTYMYAHGDLKPIECTAVEMNEKFFKSHGAALKKKPAKVVAVDPQAEYEPEEEEEEDKLEDSGPFSTKSHTQIATMLYLLITLLGGKATITAMDGLRREDQAKAFMYLHLTYRNKYLHAKEKTGRRPSFLQQYFSTKKA